MGPIVLIHPPAISKRYLKTKFMPYGMGVLCGFLKAHHVPVVQYDFLMDYLYDAPDAIDYHNPGKTFGEGDYFSFLKGCVSHAGLRDFTERYGRKLIEGVKIYAFSIIAYHQFWASLLLARFIKDHNPDAIVVFGGPFITIRQTEYLTGFGGADYWIKGSGELPLLMLYRLHELGMKIPIEEIPGIITRSGGKFIRNQPDLRPAGEEASPDFEDLDLNAYRYNHPHTGTNSLFLPYRISKGCVSRCTFCTGRLIDPFSAKPVDKIMKELYALAGRYGSKAFMFADSSINSDPALLLILCRRLAEELPEIAWYAYGRIKGFTPELLAAAKKAGCFSLFWGVESVHEPTVRLLGKGFKVHEMAATISHSIAMGINNHIHIMYNTPYETERDMAALIGFIERHIASDYVTFIPHRFLLEPESLIFTHPEKYGLTKIEKVPLGLFEREQYLFTETGGRDFADIQERNERHRGMLMPYLKKIEERELSCGGTDYPFREAM
ncbi:MAG: radical SAM protein [Syntrophales bacterium]|nr:radical SAM protein [Syntrophales bacterium]